MKTVYSESTTPPQADRQAFKGIPGDAVLYVPVGTKETYSQARGWDSFTDIREMTFTGVSELMVGQKAGTADVYNMQGMLIKAKASQEEIDALAPGLYIIGGRKVLVK